MPTDAQKIVLEAYIQSIDMSQSRVNELKEKLIALLQSWEWKPVVKALMGCKGFQEVAAITIISEHSSGATRRQRHYQMC